MHDFLFRIFNVLGGAGTRAQTPAADPEWALWPMGPMHTFWPIVAKLLFVAAILGGLALVLRFLFGPGGALREDWVDEANEEMRRAEQEQRDAAAHKDAPESGESGPDTPDSGDGDGRR